jgi:3-isopropylmalate/(R)-2-methylmalate dehydratase small subunit
MEAVKTVRGKALPLGYSDVDTDQIVPSDALKRIERTGFGEFLFKEWKEDDPDFVLNKPEHEGAVVLIAGENFGCGSSREHAVWAVADYGFGAVIAPSFADIFKNNCTKNGVLTVELPEETVKTLLEEVRKDPEAEVTVDLEGRTVSGPGVDEQFIVDDFTRHRLLNGLDDVGLTLAHEEDIESFEKTRPSYLPSVL